MTRWLIAILMMGCAGDPRPTEGPTEVVDFPIDGEAPLDLLLVIDNSGGMNFHRSELAGQIGRLIESLALDGLPDLQVGVVTSDLGTLGVVTNDSGCSRLGGEGALIAGSINDGCPYVGRFATDSAGRGGRVVNYFGSLTGIVQCMISTLPRGCGFEQHLEAMRLALFGFPVNAGFVRDEADLLILILANEDDCSVFDSRFFGSESEQLGPLGEFRCFELGVACDPDVPREPGVKHGCHPRDDSQYLRSSDHYVDYLHGLKSDPRRVTVGAIVPPSGPIEVVTSPPIGTQLPRSDLVPVCREQVAEHTFRAADPAVRLNDFVAELGDRGEMSSACEPADSWDVLERIGSIAKQQLAGDRCFDGMVLESTCEVSLIEPERATRTLDRCGDGGFPCWELVDGCIELSTSNGFRIDSRIHASCLLAP